MTAAMRQTMTMPAIAPPERAEVVESAAEEGDADGALATALVEDEEDEVVGAGTVLWLETEDVVWDVWDNMGAEGVNVVDDCESE